jgi:hypothetical protein
MMQPMRWLDLNSHQQDYFTLEGKSQISKGTVKRSGMLIVLGVEG